MCNISRRSFLKGLGAAGVVGATHFGPGVSFVRASMCEGVDRILVVIHAFGGMDNINMLPPRGSTGSVYEAYVTSNPTLGIRDHQQLVLPSSVAGSATFGIHPALAEFASVASGTAGLPTGYGVAFFNQVGFRDSAGLDITNTSHDFATEQFAAGHPVPGALPPTVTAGSGWLGRFAEGYCNGLFNVINLDSAPRYTKGDGVTVLRGGGLAGFKYWDDRGIYGGSQYIGRNQYQRDLLSEFNSLGATNMHAPQLMFRNTQESSDQAVALLQTTQLGYSAPPAGTYQYFNGESASSPALDPFQQYKDVAACVKDFRNTRARVFTLRAGNFDTHSGAGSIQNGVYGPIFRATQPDGTPGSFLGPQAGLLHRLARGVVGMLRDIERFRAVDPAIPQVTVAIVTEVGRMMENRSMLGTAPNYGSDHGQAGACIVVGAGVRNGIYAQYTPEMYLSGPWSPNHLRAQFDVRMVYRDLVERFMNRSGAGLFPGEYPTNYVAGGSIFI